MQHFRFGSRFIRRLAAQAKGEAAPSTTFGAAPPSLRHAPDSGWHRLMFWLMAPAPHDAAPPLNRLPRVREDFLAALVDIEHPHVPLLREHIKAARSLRELWHLRSDMFSLLAVAHSQSVAQSRLAGLSQHFPAHAQRSQWASL